MKMNSKLRQILLTVCSAALLVCVTVGATVAYLTSTDTVTNTFTVGKVAITLDEAKVNNAGEPIDDDGNVVDVSAAKRVTANSYKLMPGHTYTKDPIVHVDSASENCWLFVKVENGIADIEDSTNTIAAQLAAKGWTAVDGATNVYAYKSTVAGGANVPVFESFKIDQSVIGGNKPVDYVGENKYLGDYTDKKIVVTAYAIQADGFDDAAAAWTAYAAK